MTPDKQPHPPVAFGPFVLDVANAQLTRDKAPLEIAPRPFALLGHLVANAGRLVTKNELLDAVWGHHHVSESALKGVVNTLRNHLGDDTRAPSYIETVARRGYRFIASLESVAATHLPRAPRATCRRRRRHCSVATTMSPRCMRFSTRTGSSPWSAARGSARRALRLISPPVERRACAMARGCCGWTRSPTAHR